jgi:pectate lyase
MEIMRLLIALATFLILPPFASVAQAVPSFPGAEGGGALSVGGRGGRIIEVTNLNDEGSGSFRAAITESGPRIIVFRVAGVINLLSPIKVHNPYVTIAGQTAPGGGITLSGKQMSNGSQIAVYTHDIIIRYLTFRLGLGSGHSPGPGGSCCVVLYAGSSSIVLDHLTISWWDNKGYVTYSNNPGHPIYNTTMQWSLMYESHADHPVGPLTDDGSGEAPNDVNQDFHHNLFTNIGHRLPMINTKSVRWVNNIVYNYDYFAGLVQGGATCDFIGNKYKPGPLNRGNTYHEFGFNSNQSTNSPEKNMPGPPSTYLSGNIGPHQSDPNGDQWVMTAIDLADEGGGETQSPIPVDWQRSTPLPAQEFPIMASPVENLDNILLPEVGNSRRLDENGNWVNKRDVVDKRIINEYQEGTTGDFFRVEDPDHTIPAIVAGTPYQDTDHDGMPDAWETAHGLNPEDASDGNEDADGDGYTNVEEFLNGPNGSTDINAIVTDNGVRSKLNIVPNPSLIGTEINFSYVLPAGSVYLNIYTFSGHLVRCYTVNSAGTGSVCWDGKTATGRAVPPGMYLVKLVCKEVHLSRKVTILP